MPLVNTTVNPEKLQWWHHLLVLHKTKCTKGTQIFTYYEAGSDPHLEKAPTGGHRNQRELFSMEISINHTTLLIVTQLFIFPNSMICPYNSFSKNIFNICMEEKWVLVRIFSQFCSIFKFIQWTISNLKFFHLFWLLVCTIVEVLYFCQKLVRRENARQEVVILFPPTP